MKIKTYEDMDLQELDVMREISSIGTSHAATALSKLLQKEIRITIPQVSVLGYNDALARIGNAEEIVAATLVKMDQDVEGLMLFLFDLNFADTILGTLLGQHYNSFEDGSVSLFRSGRGRQYHYLQLCQCVLQTGGCGDQSFCSQFYGQYGGRHFDGTYGRIRI